MNLITTSKFKTREVRDLRQWIKAGGSSIVTEMIVWRKADGSAMVWTKFSNGEVHTNEWASYAVFSDYMLRRPRNFRGVTFTVHDVKADMF